MMKKVNTIYHFRSLRGRFLAAILALVAMLLGATQSEAQNVTIGPKNGSLVAGLAGGNSADSGAGRGMSSMWRHEQLSLMMTTSDIANLTAAGELADPSNAIDTFDVDRVLPQTGQVTQNGPEPTRLIIGAGSTQTFVVVSLPKGYRITRYRLVLQPNISGNGIRLHQDVAASEANGNKAITYNTWNIGEDDQMCFYETPAWSSGSPYGNTTHSNQLTCPDALATATAADGSTTMLNNNATNRAKEFVIERTSMTDDDMSNQLYFFFASNGTTSEWGDTPYQYAVSIKSFEIHFTAQGTFDAAVAPIESSNAVSVVSSPFPTSKMDIGALAWRTWTDNGGNQKQVYAYDFSQVRDLIGYNTLYQSDAVSASGVPEEGVAGENHIFPLELNGKGVYAFGNGTYYIEPPITINGSSGWPSPIGYRVVGATFSSDWGTARKATEITIKNGCTVSVSYNNQDYFLNSNLDFVRSTTTNPAFVWKMDEYGNLFYGDEYKHYLACFGSGDNRILSVSSSATGDAARWNLKIDDNDRLVYHSDGGNDYYLYYTRIQEGNDYHLRGYVERDHNGNLATAHLSEDGFTKTIPAYAPGSFTLVVYDEKGDVKERVPVNSSNAKTLKYPLSGLNNDALKFGIEGLGLVPDPADETKTVPAQAVVNVTLQLESLNPYIDKMDIVCHDIPETGDPTLELTQTFKADDFSVSGGKFVFYVPEEYSTVPLKFTFSDLWSKYGDDTYYHDVPSMKMNGTARYSFVTSDYFQKVDGEGGDGGLYGDNYQLNDKGSNDPDAGEGNYYPYIDKVNTSTAGNVRFKFNNAEDIMNPSSPEKFLKEYPFSVDLYLHGEDGNGYANPDNVGPTKAGYEVCRMIATPTTTHPDLQRSKIYYVFTADETRYNIAPTTAWQHRLYAFYRMDIELEARQFEPDFTWTKIYDATSYEQKDESGKVQDASDSMWGLTLGIVPARDENNNLVLDDDGNPIKGYFTYQEIVDEIQNNLLDENNTNGPASMSQILYVDGTPLKEMLNSNTESTTAKTLNDFKKLLAVNALVFLPENTTSTLDNVVLEETGGSNTRSFVAGKDIVLKDKQPFFTPYTFKIDAANKVTYSREISGAGNTLAKYATIMMPFTLTVSDGKHSNETEDGFEFYLRTMTGFDGAQTGEAAVAEGTGYFTKIEGTKAAANIPYMVEVVDQKSDVYSFVATQKGAEIVASPSRTATTQNPWIGLTAIEAENVGDMTNYGTYSGAAIPRATEVFYFNRNKYVSSSTLASKYTHVYVRPFRSYYTSSSINSKMTWFDIVYDQVFNPVVTDIAKESLPNNLSINTGHGFMMLTANEDVHVNVVSLNGLNLASFDMEAGDQNVIEIPAGIYLVNKTKVIVK